MEHHSLYLDFQGKALYGSENIFKLYFVVVVVLVFYGLLTLVVISGAVSYPNHTVSGQAY